MVFFKHSGRVSFIIIAYCTIRWKRIVLIWYIKKKIIFYLNNQQAYRGQAEVYLKMSSLLTVIMSQQENLSALRFFSAWEILLFSSPCRVVSFGIPNGVTFHLTASGPTLGSLSKKFSESVYFFQCSPSPRPKWQKRIGILCILYILWPICRRDYPKRNLISGRYCRLLFFTADFLSLWTELDGWLTWTKI